MLALPLSEIAGIIDGELLQQNQLNNISHVITDSRTHFGSGNPVFFALEGPANNGHAYISQLLKKGVKAFVISDRKYANENAAYILVENTRAALQKLAAYHRSKHTYPVVGVTGSNGKTIVKEWLFDVLSKRFNIVRSPKSYNSQIGVPLSVMHMNTEHNLAIFEAGISLPGEMEKLEPMLLPELGILTNIGDAHQENFSSLNEKLQEKLKLFVHSKKIVAHTDDELIAKEVNSFCKKNAIDCVDWSFSNADSHLQISVKKSAQKSQITVIEKQNSWNFSIPFSDDSAIENACHCFASLVALDLNPEDFLSHFNDLTAVAMRLEIKQGINQCLLINDYYNSDLNSLEIALSVLNQQAARTYSRKEVVLSDILQSGLQTDELYSKVNRLLLDWKIDKIIGIGEEISAARNAFSIDSEFFPNRTSFEAQFRRNQFKGAAVLIKGARQFAFEKISALLQEQAHQSVLEINLNAMVHNLNTFRGMLKTDTKIMAMVKAFSYGSGDVEVAHLLQYMNIDYLAVAVADEGVKLRNAGILTPIIVMNPEQDSFQNMIDFRLEPNIYGIELLDRFNAAAQQNNAREFPVHLKIDTGMNRLGVKNKAELSEVIAKLKQMPNLKVQSVFSHLAGSDEAVFDDFTQSQFEKFEDFSTEIINAFSYKIDRHILNSAGIERFPQHQYNMVRLGIGLYGVSSTGLPLENIGTLKSTISQIKTVQNTETVGYSRKGKIAEESKIAIIPMGYADGINRRLGNGNGSVFVNGKLAPIIGNVCMDMLMIDVTGIDATAGDSVEFFGKHISISSLAKQLETIPYEILTSISRRVKRIYVQE